jgi:hypothetical protein
MPFGESPSAMATSPNPRSLDALEAELTTLAAHIGAAMYRFLVLVEEFDRREGWGGIGLRSCAHWLTWKCGIGLVAAREQVRVARALPRLAAIAEAMRTGRVSYAKVRAMTRIATPDNESALLAIALNGTASHVERVVRAYRRTSAAEERAQALAQEEARSLSCYWDHDGCLVVRGRLPKEQGAQLMKALEAADQALRTEHANDSAESSTVREARSYLQRQADALALMAETTLAHGIAALAAGERHLVHVHVDLDALSDAGAAEEPFGRCDVEDGPALARDVARRLACDGGVVALFENGEGKTLDVGRKTRAIPPALRRALAARDRGCRFPGCTCTRFVDAHHIDHWADGGVTSLHNLALLCRLHHRLVHEGGFSIATRNGGLVFRDPCGREILEAPPLRGDRGRCLGRARAHARRARRLDHRAHGRAGVGRRATGLHVPAGDARPARRRRGDSIGSIIKGVDMQVRRVPGTGLGNPQNGRRMYTPPDGADRLRDMLANWERFLHEERELDPLVRMAVRHYTLDADATAVSTSLRCWALAPMGRLLPLLRSHGVHGRTFDRRRNQ